MHSLSKLHVPDACVISAVATDPNDWVAEIVRLEVISRSVHIFVPSLLSGESKQCASNPAQLFAHLTIAQVEPSAPSHSSKGKVLDAA